MLLQCDSGIAAAGKQERATGERTLQHKLFCAACVTQLARDGCITLTQAACFANQDKSMQLALGPIQMHSTLYILYFTRPVIKNGRQMCSRAAHGTALITSMCKAKKQSSLYCATVDASSQSRPLPGRCTRGKIILNFALCCTVLQLAQSRQQLSSAGSTLQMHRCVRRRGTLLSSDTMKPESCLQHKQARSQMPQNPTSYKDFYS